MDNHITVQLTGPAKIGGKWRQPGDEVAVTPEIARELAATGVVGKGIEVDLLDLASGMPVFDEAVAEQAKLLADDAIAAAVEAATAELVADRDAARARAADAEAEVSRQHSQIMAHEAEIADLEAARASLAAQIAALTTPDEPPNEQGDGSAAATVSKSARKKASDAKG